MELRPYQKEIIDIIDNLNNGSYLVQLATGLGKTVTFANIKRKGRVN
jgi:superfamily II DNA or RNA helicase